MEYIVTYFNNLHFAAMIILNGKPIPSLAFKNDIFLLNLCFIIQDMN